MTENPRKDVTADGRVVRDAWIAGVHAHYPGEPKASYVAPWEDMPAWERAVCAGIFAHVERYLHERGKQATAESAILQSGCSAVQ